jgi:hypothetical protein
LPNEEKAWLTHEEVSGLFERALNLGSTVNVSTRRDRPDITGARRQLDVEILTGTGNRQTRSIVEVQKRKQKVGINDYEAWIEKKRKLNAALLIGVSEQGFTDEALKAAQHSNPYDVKLGLLQIVDARDVHPHFKSKFEGFVEMNGLTTYLSDFELHTTDGRVVNVGSGLFNQPLFGSTTLQDLVNQALLGRWHPFEDQLLRITLQDQPTLKHESLTDSPTIETVIVRAKYEVSTREPAVEYYLYKQVFPNEEMIGACMIVENIRANNVAGSLAMILLPDPKSEGELGYFEFTAS